MPTSVAILRALAPAPSPRRGGDRCAGCDRVGTLYGFERADAVVGRVEMLLTHRLPLGHVDANLARIRAVTVDEVNAAYAEIIEPEALSVASSVTRRPCGNR